MSLADYRATGSYDQLSIRDLLDARDQYHIHLMQHANVVATAIGRYRIRINDSWPTAKGEGKVHGTYARTLENSEVRSYSWPAILVFVQKWEDLKRLKPSDVVPKTLYLSDGRKVPVCVIEAPKEQHNETRRQDTAYPVNNIGGGWPVIAESQGRRYEATIACLVSDGHTIYAMTNRHVSGDAGEIVYSRLGGKQERIGVSSAKQLTRMPFTSLYPGWPGRDVYVNLDIGLIEVDNLDQWTAEIRNIGQMGRMVDLSVDNISLSLIGADVQGTGAGTGQMQGEIAALFYRYNTNGGFEYIADIMIGPRSGTAVTGKGKSSKTPAVPPFATHPGDSGTLWLLEVAAKMPAPQSNAASKKTGKQKQAALSGKPQFEYLPLAMQWGRNMLYSAASAPPQSYALATFVSRVCAELNVDPVRNWNLDQPDTWSALGHFAIAARAQVALSGRYPKLDKLMNNNALIISHDDQAMLKNNFKGMGSADFVPLADVPDFFWKPRIAKQGFARSFEGPNHFADMDQPNDQGKTLLDLCKAKAFIDPVKWDAFYDSIVNLATGKKIDAGHRGLLPFRVWQLFDAMAQAAEKGRRGEYVCAAGVLTHYIGDACQPLHISYLHDGDPENMIEYVFKRGKREGESEMRPFGKGVHSGYEDAMVSAFKEEVLDGLKSTPKAKKSELITTGFEAAQLTIDMMRQTFKSIPPRKIVEVFGSFDGKPKERAELLWKKFGPKTITNMQSGAHLLAVLWESAWVKGNGERNVKSTAALSEENAMEICARPNFVPSVTIDRIGKLLV